MYPRLPFTARKNRSGETVACLSKADGADQYAQGALPAVFVLMAMPIGTVLWVLVAKWLI